MITIEPPLGLQVADIKLSLKLPPDMILALFFGYIVMNGTVPSEIGGAVDELQEEDIPSGWKMVVEMWKNRGDAVEVCKVISPWLKEAL